MIATGVVVTPTSSIGVAHKLTDEALLNHYALRVWDAPSDEKASEVPQTAPVTTSASSLLEGSLSARLTEEFDKAWTSRIANYLQWQSVPVTTGRVMRPEKRPSAVTGVLVCEIGGDGLCHISPV